MFISGSNAPLADEIIELDGSRLLYFRNYISDPDACYNALLEQSHWQQPELTIFGQTRKVRRLVSFVGDPGVAYRYSGHRHFADPWPGILSDINRQLHSDFEFGFNSALLNYYRNGSEGMGYHSDDEPELGPAPVIASLSLGCERDFVFRRKGGGRQQLSLPLAHGSLLLMLPPCQRDWQHALPERKRVKAGRINLTYRRIFA
ncbi:alpha-ketoglutarate-dependent dioxygenase AlkB [Spongiibacter sp. KMU-158]|uniref:Alpha-ketoglutarate-dependent dioxygenase AlkB n=1 Tax=Spongiibacter pelagi TaxID=2760804 RepID=A0A927C0M5_9GAMM|nr:alpha-ketoglutarate-dependent dioxygenase AlkB [Spongiibacter pelagi]MBD2859078.1 alpha-ketoglutarate-dependent dioxygenase AlkB [Spongiibacter pelagi]